MATSTKVVVSEGDSREPDPGLGDVLSQILRGNDPRDESSTGDISTVVESLHGSITLKGLARQSCDHSSTADAIPVTDVASFNQELTRRLQSMAGDPGQCNLNTRTTSADPAQAFLDIQYDIPAYQRYLSLVHESCGMGMIRGLVCQCPMVAGRAGALHVDGEGEHLTRLSRKVIGPAKVIKQHHLVMQECILEAEGIARADAQSDFGTVQADVALFGNHWSFDVTILTPGRIVIGWYTGLALPPNGRLAPVGSVSGIGLDGNTATLYVRGDTSKVGTEGQIIQTTSASTSSTIPLFCVGDVITACADLDTGLLAYYRNGDTASPIITFPLTDMDSVHQNGLIPAVSLMRGQRVRINFGATPMARCHPHTDIGAPLRPPPFALTHLHMMVYLTSCLERVHILPYTWLDNASRSLVLNSIIVRMYEVLMALDPDEDDGESVSPLATSRLCYYVRAVLMPTLYRLNAYDDTQQHVVPILGALGTHLSHDEEFRESLALGMLLAVGDFVRTACPITQVTAAALAPVEASGGGGFKVPPGEFSPRMCGAVPAIEVGTMLLQCDWVHQAICHYASTSLGAEPSGTGHTHPHKTTSPSTRKLNYDRYLELIFPLFATKPVSPFDLEKVFPDLPAQGALDVNTVRNLVVTDDDIRARARWMTEITRARDRAHVRMIQSLDGPHNCGLFGQFVDLLTDNVGSRLHHLLARDVILRATLKNFVHALVTISVPVDGVVSPHYPSRFFLPTQADLDNTSRDAYDPGRLGGVQSHLWKEHGPPTRREIPAIPRDWTSELNAEDVLVGEGEGEGDIFVEAQAVIRERREVFLDRCVRMYSTALAPSFKGANSAILEYSETAERLRKRMLPTPTPSMDELKPHLAAVTRAKRRVLFTRIVVYDAQRQHVLARLCAALGELLLRVAQDSSSGLNGVTDRDNVLFLYVPEFYLEVYIDSFHALRRADPAYDFTTGLGRGILDDVITVLMGHFHDGRIINPDLRDLLLQSVSVLLQYKNFIPAVENNALTRSQFMPSLLRCFDNRFWIPITNIICRIWRGNGFGQNPADVSSNGSSALSPTTPSLRALFTVAAKQDPELFAKFCNQLFNNSSWTMTELGVCVKEILSIMQGHSRINADESRKVTELAKMSRKCNVVFELSSSLLRIMELIAIDFPDTFLDNNTQCARLLETICTALNMTVSTRAVDASAFARLAGLQLPVLIKISEPPLLNPVSGILVALTVESSDIYPVLSDAFVRQLSTHMAFDIARAEQLTQFASQAADRMRLAQALALVRAAVDLESEGKKRKVSSRKASSEVVDGEHGWVSSDSDTDSSLSDSLCTICYHNNADTTFVPCGHESCHQCISRHLLNDKTCFFCKADVESTQAQPTSPKTLM